MLDTRKPWLLMKFGGTSIGTADRIQQTISIIEKQRENGSRPIVVLSAMSSTQKKLGTTSRLLAAVEDVLVPDSNRYLEIIDSLEIDHIKCAGEAVPDLKIRNRLIHDLRSEFQRLRNFLEAAEIIDELSPRTRDIVIGYGEKLSCMIFRAALEVRGVSAVMVGLDKCVVDGSRHRSAIQATADLGSTTQLDQSFYDRLKRQISSIVYRAATAGNRSETDNFDGLEVIPVVTGFIGYIPGGIINTIGRGYTDFTAALIAAGLKEGSGDARLPQSVLEVQIWKEVDGIFTADPRKVNNARLLPRIYPDEAAELTYYGSEVIHPFTMEQVMRARIPIRIKNTFSPDGCGTTILIDDVGSAVLATPESSTKLIRATAVTLKDVFCINIHSNRKSVSHGFLAKIFTLLDKHGVVVDLISTSEVHISMAVSTSSNNSLLNSTPPQSPVMPLSALHDVKKPPQAEDADKCNIGDNSNSLVVGNDDENTTFASNNIINSPTRLDQLISDLEVLGEVSVLHDMAILSLVGKQMKNMVGIAGKMFDTLAKHKVNIEMISQGASEINISCVVTKQDANRAMQSVHDACVLGDK